MTRNERQANEHGTQTRIDRTWTTRGFQNSSHRTSKTLRAHSRNVLQTIKSPRARDSRGEAGNYVRSSGYNIQRPRFKPSQTERAGKRMNRMPDETPKRVPPRKNRNARHQTRAKVIEVIQNLITLGHTMNLEKAGAA